MEKHGNALRYELAAAILPSRLRRIAMEQPEEVKEHAEEFRLRAGRCMSVLLPAGEQSLEIIVTVEELETLCDIAAEFSRYASIETLRQGFLPVRGGFRVGLCGAAVMKDGQVTNLKQISSAVIRISRELKGIGAAVVPRLFRGEHFASTLLLSPPGGGKTTLLRILMGLEVPDSGTLSGTDVRWSAVFQEDRLLPGLDAMENLRFVLGPDMDNDAAAAQLRALGLDPSPGQCVRSWSGGMRRRLALARALLAPADALALDEPFTGLDTENRQRAAACIAQAAERMPVLLVTHDPLDLSTLRARCIKL